LKLKPQFSQNWPVLSVPHLGQASPTAPGTEPERAPEPGAALGRAPEPGAAPGRAPEPGAAPGTGAAGEEVGEASIFLPHMSQ
jgi:hypothetical protein